MLGIIIFHISSISLGMVPRVGDIRSNALFFYIVGTAHFLALKALINRYLFSSVRRDLFWGGGGGEKLQSYTL